MWKLNFQNFCSDYRTANELDKNYILEDKLNLRIWKTKKHIVMRWMRKLCDYGYWLGVDDRCQMKDISEGST
jgi:hypothetical protein